MNSEHFPEKNILREFQNETGGDTEEYSHLMRRAQELAKVGGWEINLNDNSLFWTEEVYRIHEVPLDVKPVLEEGISFYPPESKPIITAVVEEAIEKGTPWDLELAFISARGNHKWIRTIGYPEREENRTVRLSGIFQDITTEKELRLQLEANEKTLKEAQRIAKIGSWTWYPSDGRMIWSDQLYALLEVNKDELNGFIHDFYPFIHPEDVDHVKSIAQQAVEEKKAIPVEYRIITSNGKMKYIRGEGTQEIDENGELIKLMGTLQDITDRKIAEEEVQEANQVYNTIIESTMAGYWDWMIQEDYEYMSPGFKKMFGYEDDEIPNTPEWWQANVHPDDLNEVFEIFQKHVESKGEIPYDNEVRYYHKDGSIVWVYCRGEVIEWDEKGNPVRMVGSHINITKLKRAEEQVNTKLQELEFKNRELEQFAYISSHDLQEPLRTVKSYVQLLGQKYKEDFDEKGEKYFQFIEQSVERMQEFIHGLLEYSRIGRETELKKVDMRLLVEQAMTDLSVSIEETGAKINLGKLPSVSGYQQELRQLFMNLISNAMKFVAPEVTPEVTIAAKKIKKNWQFSVTDKGIGIDEKFKEKVFIIFQRLHARNVYEGTGIGLAHCKKIVELHKGELWFESEEGKGTTFYFTLNL